MLMTAQTNGDTGRKQLENYTWRLDQATAQDKLDILVSLLDTSVYSYISECQTFDSTLARLDGAFVKLMTKFLLDIA